MVGETLNGFVNRGVAEHPSVDRGGGQARQRKARGRLRLTRIQDQRITCLFFGQQVEEGTLLRGFEQFAPRGWVEASCTPAVQYDEALAFHGQDGILESSNCSPSASRLASPSKRL